MLLPLMLFIGCSNVFASIENYTRSFNVQFDTGNSYYVLIDGDSLLWRGIAGEDKNTEKKLKIKHLSLAKNIEVFQ